MHPQTPILNDAPAKYVLAARVTWYESLMEFEYLSSFTGGGIGATGSSR